jgi:hypothetical protein
VTPYAGATSLEGHTLTPFRGVSIDMNQMKVCAAFITDEHSRNNNPSDGLQKRTDSMKYIVSA